jgi:HEPN domain-containing protein
MSEVTDPLAWVQRAEEDYTTARYALRRKNPALYIACFHAQQCGEKYLKALLITQNTAFPKTHDLQILSDLCTRTGIVVGIDPRQLHDLAEHAVRIRYPGEDPTLDDARRAIETARSIRRFARKILGLR